jgi:hypothetical protein
MNKRGDGEMFQEKADKRAAPGDEAGWRFPSNPTHSAIPWSFSAPPVS